MVGMTEIVKIPVERVKVLVGEHGATKKRIERRCNVELVIDPEGEIEIVGEAADIYFVRDVIKAIGRGFPSQASLKLLESEFGLYIIQMKEFAHTEKAISRLKGRVIGENGKIKMQIEEATDSFLSIYGNTVGIISRIDTMDYAKEAISMILNGARHTSVLAYLAKAKREIMEARLRT